MKHLTVVILLALAPLSWGKDEVVFYCEKETEYKISYLLPKEAAGRWRERTRKFDGVKSDRFLTKVNSQKIEMTNRDDLIWKSELVTSRFDIKENTALGSTSITVEGKSEGKLPYTLRLRGWVENGTYPYMLVYASFRTYPRVEHEAGTCTKF